jgi:hypothetical protein
VLYEAEGDAGREVSGALRVSSRPVTSAVTGNVARVQGVLILSIRAAAIPPL